MINNDQNNEHSNERTSLLGTQTSYKTSDISINITHSSNQPITVFVNNDPVQVKEVDETNKRIENAEFISLFFPAKSGLDGAGFMFGLPKPGKRGLELYYLPLSSIQWEGETSLQSAELIQVAEGAWSFGIVPGVTRSRSHIVDALNSGYKNWGCNFEGCNQIPVTGNQILGLLGSHFDTIASFLSKHSTFTALQRHASSGTSEKQKEAIEDFIKLINDGKVRSFHSSALFIKILLEVENRDTFSQKYNSRKKISTTDDGMELLRKMTSQGDGCCLFSPPKPSETKAYSLLQKFAEEVFRNDKGMLYLVEPNRCIALYDALANRLEVDNSPEQNVNNNNSNIPK